MKWFFFNLRNMSLIFPCTQKNYCRKFHMFLKYCSTSGLLLSNLCDSILRITNNTHGQNGQLEMYICISIHCSGQCQSDAWHWQTRLERSLAPINTFLLPYVYRYVHVFMGGIHLSLRLWHSMELEVFVDHVRRFCGEIF